MKKTLSVLLCIIMLFVSTAVCASAEGATIKMTVASDIHYNLNISGAEKLSKRNSISEDYSHVSMSGDLPAESLAIVKAFFDKAAASDSDYVLLTGDLVDSGIKAGHEAFALMLKEFEAKTGKRVFVVPGNHDLYGVSAAEFSSIYADFGYNEALAKDSKSISYTVELKGGYRLLVIDSTNPGESSHGITAERIEWIKTQCNKAKSDGKYLVVAMHHNLLERTSAATFLHGDTTVDTSLGIADILADAGVRFVFTGHSHIQDVAAYKSAAGNTVYEVVTASLNSYPLPYRVVSFGSQTSIDTVNIDKIDTSLVPDGMSEKAFALMEKDLLKYSKTCFELAVNQQTRNVVSENSLKKYLEIDEEKNPEMALIADEAISRMAEALIMPLYVKDEVEKGKSLQRILATYDVLLPETDCKTMAELATLFYIAFTEGDENYTFYSYEVFAFTRGMSAVINYGLANATGEDYAQIMSYLTSFSKFTVPAGVFSYAGDGVAKFRGIETYIATCITPVVASYTTDDAPADNDVVLEGYEPAPPAAEEKEKSFWEKIADFFKRVYDYLMSIFTYYDK